MRAMEMAVVGTDEIEQYVNCGVDMTIRQLKKDGIISEDAAESALKEYHITTIKKSWHRRIWDALTGNESNKEVFVMTKVTDTLTNIVSSKKE
ncbi:MAG: hypothetical protein KAS32_12740 [Candidatus Peribacteraceae bacterium]|nr:hypothetical protein [Candidatus Peribacteraceae bacterium]